MKEGDFNKIKQLFFKYMHCYVVNSDEMILQLFHLLLGAILTKMGVRISSNKEFTLRCSNFTISSSGTGKGEAQDALANIIKSLNKEAQSRNLPTLNLLERIAEFSTAGWVGTIERVVRRIEPIYGMLKINDVILVPEAKNFFDKSESICNLRHKLTSALDEPGTVTKRLRLGDITYTSLSSVATTTIPIIEVNYSLTQEGFLQRFLISFKEFSEKEKNEIDKRKAELRKLDFQNDIKPIEDELVSLLVNLMAILKWTAFSIKIKRSDIPKMEQLRIGLRQRYFRRQYNDTRNEIIDSFYERLENHLLKISAQHAVVEGKREIDINDYEYVVEVLRWHCESIGRLLDKLEATREDFTKKKRETIYNIIKSRGGSISRWELFNILSQSYKQRLWDLGETRTHQFIKNMIMNRELRFRTETKGKKFYILP